MADSTGYRITVCFTDQKSSLVYVDTDNFQTVQDLKDHIRELFAIPHSDFDLFCENYFLPPIENVRVVKPDDVLLIVSNKCVNCIKKKRKLSIEEDREETVEKITPPDTSIKKKKKISNITVTPYPKLVKNKSTPNELSATTNGFNTNKKISFFEHLSHSSDSKSSNSDSNNAKRKELSSILKSDAAKSKEKLIPCEANDDTAIKETPTYNKCPKKRPSTPYVHSIGVLLSKIKSIKNESKEENDNADNAHNDTDSPTSKKRKRYRKRKRPAHLILETTEPTSSSSIIFPKPNFRILQSMCFNKQATSSTERTHIKFSDDVEIIDLDREGRDLDRDMDRDLDRDMDRDLDPHPEEAYNVNSNGGIGGSSDSAIEVTPNDCDDNDNVVQEVVDLVAMPIDTPHVTLESISKSPSMKHITPKPGDLIAFKMLKMSENYTPEFSEYIVSRVIHYNMTSKSIFLQVIEGAEQMKLPNGKFSLEALEDIEEDNLREPTTLDWDSLIDPRLLYP